MRSQTYNNSLVHEISLVIVGKPELREAKVAKAAQQSQDSKRLTFNLCSSPLLPTASASKKIHKDNSVPVGTLSHGDRGGRGP